MNKQAKFNFDVTKHSDFGISMHFTLTVETYRGDFIDKIEQLDSCFIPMHWKDWIFFAVAVGLIFDFRKDIVQQRIESQETLLYTWNKSPQA